jgi:hypothetical protein
VEGHDEANIRFTQYCKRAKKWQMRFNMEEKLIILTNRFACNLHACGCVHVKGVWNSTSLCKDNDQAIKLKTLA